MSEITKFPPNRIEALVNSIDLNTYELLYRHVMSASGIELMPEMPIGNGDVGGLWRASVNEFVKIIDIGRFYPNGELDHSAFREYFYKLKAHCETISPIEDLYFVFNDRYQGAPAAFKTLLQELANENPSIDGIHTYTMDEIEHEWIELGHGFVDETLKIFKSIKSNHEIYHYLMNCFEQLMCLDNWDNINRRLTLGISLSEENIQSFLKFATIVEKTRALKPIQSIDYALKELVNLARELVTHFTEADCTRLTKKQRWKLDLRWQKEKLDADEQAKLENTEETWRAEFYRLHYNMIYAMNLLTKAFRDGVKPQFREGKVFTIADGHGEYNVFRGKEAIPIEFK